jgi:hypothetical protein
MWEVIGRRSVHQGDLNSTAGELQFASFHACAGEDFQKAILYREMTFGMVDADTYLSAASYVAADAMLSDNQTLKDQAREYILGNLSIYLGDQDTAVLISVIEGRTQLGGVSSIMRMAGLGLVAGFILFSSYVVLIWEPKNPVTPDAKSREPQAEEGIEGALDGELVDESPVEKGEQDGEDG